MLLLALLVPIAVYMGFRAQRQWSDYQEAERLYLECDELMDRGKIEQAIPKLEKCVALCPDMPAGWDALSSCYFHIGQGDRALELLRQAAQRFPKSKVIIQSLGNAQLMTGHKKEAAEAFAMACELDPTDPFVRRMRDRCEKENGAN